MGLFSTLFSSKAKTQKLAGAQPKPASREAEKPRVVASSGTPVGSAPTSQFAPRPIGAAALQMPTPVLPRSITQRLSPGPAALPPPRSHELAMTNRGANSHGHITLTLADLMPRIPVELLNGAPADLNRELCFPLAPLTAELAKGRAAVPLADVIQQCPEIFREPSAANHGAFVVLPLQKLLEQIGRHRKTQLENAPRALSAPAPVALPLRPTQPEIAVPPSPAEPVAAPLQVEDPADRVFTAPAIEFPATNGKPVVDTADSIASSIASDEVIEVICEDPVGVAFDESSTETVLPDVEVLTIVQPSVNPPEAGMGEECVVISTSSFEPTIETPSPSPAEVPAICSQEALIRPAATVNADPVYEIDDLEFPTAEAAQTTVEASQETGPVVAAIEQTTLAFDEPAPALEQTASLPPEPLPQPFATVEVPVPPAPVAKPPVSAPETRRLPIPPPLPVFARTPVEAEPPAPRPSLPEPAPTKASARSERGKSRTPVQPTGHSVDIAKPASDKPRTPPRFPLRPPRSTTKVARNGAPVAAPRVAPPISPLLPPRSSSPVVERKAIRQPQLFGANPLDRYFSTKATPPISWNAAGVLLGISGDVTLSQVTKAVAELSEVRACFLVTPPHFSVAGIWPESMRVDNSLAFARRLSPQLRRCDSGTLSQSEIMTGAGVLSLFALENVLLCVLTDSATLPPAIRQKLAVLTKAIAHARHSGSQQKMAGA